MREDDTIVGEDRAPTPDRASGQRRRPIERGELLGRYVTLSRLGSGGMGTVFAAYDPELDRKVAVKLLHAGPGSRAARDSQDRLRREAQAMAKLKHRNVVQVFDVGEVDGRVFVAMEFVDGDTLGERIEAAKGLDWRARLELCLQAGRGLSAAHAAGLVHRDFKPDNVMIERGGRVVVMDFGLARAAGEPLDATSGEQAPVRGEASSPRELSGITERSLTSMRVTQAGELVGSPAYMAPEQFLGGETDARTDQFAFCLVVWEVLYGERPFGGESIAARAFAVSTGKIRDPPASRGVPSRIHRALLRGLSVEPGQRWPDMDALLAELGRDPTALWRRHLAWLAPTGLALSLAGALWLRPAAPTGPEPCTGADDVLSEVWNSEIRADVVEGFSAVDLPFAADTGARVVQRLDRWGAEWIEGHRSACLAHARGEQSDVLLDLRMACLDHRRADLAALLAALAKPDTEVVQRAVRAVASLPTVAPCSDVVALRSTTPPPEDPDVRAAVDAAESKLAEARASYALADYQRARDVLEELLPRAETLGYAPLRAEAHLLEGRVSTALGDFDAGARQLEGAYHLALESGADGTAMNAAAALGLAEGYHRGRDDIGLGWVRHGFSLAARAGQPPDESSELYNARGVLHFVRGEYAEAAADHERARTLRIEVHGEDHPLVAFSSNNLATVAYEQGDHAGAVAAFEDAIGVLEAALGPEHPTCASLLTNMGSALQQEGQAERAVEAHERALRIWERAFGTDHPDVAFALNNLANAEQDRGRFEEALAHHERALRIRRATYGEEHPLVASSVSNLGMVHTRLEHWDEALRLLEESVALSERANGEAHADTARAHHNLASFHLERGDLVRARAEAFAALEVRERALGADHVALVEDLLLLMALERKSGNLEEAKALATRASALIDAHRSPGHPDRWELAFERGMIALGEGHREEGRALLEQARDGLATLGHPHRLDEELRATLAALDDE